MKVVDTPAPCQPANQKHTAIIHEAALRMRFGGPNLMRAQLKQLLDMSEQRSTTVLVIPFSAGTFPSAGQTVVYTHEPVAALDTVQLDTEYGSVFLHAERQLEKYRTIMEQFEALSLEESDSRDFLHTITDELREVTMRPLDWQKSSYSSEASSCVEVATSPQTLPRKKREGNYPRRLVTSAIHIREGDIPDVIMNTSSLELRALLNSVKNGTLDDLVAV